MASITHADMVQHAYVTRELDCMQVMEQVTEQLKDQLSLRKL